MRERPGEVVARTFSDLREDDEDSVFQSFSGAATGPSRAVSPPTVTADRACKAGATKEIFIAAGGDLAMYTTQKDRLLHLFTLLQASDLS